MKRIDASYRFVNAAYFTIIFSIIGSTSLYLANLGVKNAYIGIVVAIANIAAVILQPVFGRLADRSEKITVQRLLKVCALVIVIFSVVMAILGGFLDTKVILIPQCILFTATLIVVQFMNAFTNALGMMYVTKGYPVNYGVARGTGSLFYALSSYLVGLLITWTGINVIPVFTAVMGVITIISVKRFEKAVALAIPETIETEKKEQPAEQIKTVFFKKYPRFMVLLAATAVVFTCHTIINNYLYQIIVSVGGNTADFGFAAALYAIVEIPTMFLFVYINKKVTSGNLLKIACLFFVLKAFLCILATGMSMIYIAMIMQFGGYALFIPASVYYTNNLVAESDQATGQAFMTAAIAVGSVVGSLIGGAVIDGAGIHAAILTAVCIGLGGGIIMLFASDGKVV